MQDGPERILHIGDGKEVITIPFAEALASHRGDAYWGCALAFRLMQRAEQLLSTERLWNRNQLSIVSGHPGPGVRDVIEYVTHCVSEDRYRLTSETSEFRCVGNMSYEWWLTHDDQVLHLQLRDGFVPPQFLLLLESINTGNASEQDKEQLEVYKQSLTQQIWQDPLDATFLCRFLQQAPTL